MLSICCFIVDFVFLCFRFLSSHLDTLENIQVILSLYLFLHWQSLIFIPIHEYMSLPILPSAILPYANRMNLYIYIMQFCQHFVSNKMLNEYEFAVYIIIYA